MPAPQQGVPDQAGAPRSNPPPSRFRLGSGTVQVVVAIALVSAAAWAFVAWTTLAMAYPVTRLMMPATASWSLATVLAVLAMWSGMMVAMMLPSASPMIVAFHRVEAGSGRSGSARSRSLAFAGAYVLVWAGYSVAAAITQWAFQAGGVLAPMLVASRSEAVAASLLILAGLYQLTPWKQACLKHCRSPDGFLLAHWRGGGTGAFSLGIRHGLYCVGCCWALMLLLFVAGVMNPAWIVALAVLVALEKWPVLPGWLPRAIGMILVIAGAVMLF